MEHRTIRAPWSYVTRRQQRNPLNKSLRVLREMLNLPGEECGVRELARALGLPASTIHRTLAMLEQEGLVQINAQTGQYRIGLEFYRMAWRAQAKYPVRDIAMRHAQNITVACNETVCVGLYDPMRREMFFAGVVDSTHQLRYVLPLNEWLPVYLGASGLAIMAFLSDEERRLIIQQAQPPIDDPAGLERALDDIRKNGYAVTRGQRIPGAVGIAAPIRSVDDRVVGDLVLTIPEQRFDSSQEPELARQVMYYAALATRDLGGTATVPETP